MGRERMYDQLAEWWPLISSPEEYAAEAEVLRSIFQERLAALGDHPLVGETRGIGLLGALELVKDKATRARFEPKGRAGLTCRSHCFEQGVIMRAVGDTMFLSPPLVICRDEIDEMFELIRRCLDLTVSDLEKPPADS